jgi:MarR family transcriptional regulator for hemolysin
MTSKKIKACQAELTAGFAITGRHWARLVEHSLGTSGLSGSQCIALLMIGRSGGGIHQVALAELIGVAGPSLVRHIDRLCEINMVRREEDAQDRRAKKLYLTDLGAKTAAKLEMRLGELREHVLGHLPLADLEAALRVQHAFNRAGDTATPL